MRNVDPICENEQVRQNATALEIFQYASSSRLASDKTKAQTSKAQPDRYQTSIGGGAFVHQGIAEP